MSLNKPYEKLIKELGDGYKEMAKINLMYAEEAVEVDNECLSQYEEKLTECD